jgi:hypothetical protein
LSNRFALLEVGRAEDAEVWLKRALNDTLIDMDGRPRNRDLFNRALATIEVRYVCT